MKPRLALLALLLVVLPTAVLSLLASRMLRNWEVVLDSRLQSGAEGALQSVVSRTDDMLEHAMQQVSATLAESVVGGGTPRAMEAAAGRLRAAGGIIRRVFLFMNPWGFVYPPEGDLTADPFEALKASLRREIATARGKQTDFRLTVEDASYCFAALPGKPGLYAGFEVDERVFGAWLKEMLDRFSRGGVVLVSEGPGTGQPREGRDEAAQVVVSGSFEPSAEVGNAAPDGSARVLAEGRLRPPFDFIRIRALLRNPAEVRKAGSFEARLYAWGIALLAGGILAGAWLVLRQAASEIARARARSTYIMGLSHDLRTPMSSMKMLAESLYLGYVADPAKQKQFLATIMRESDRLNRLVERVLFLVRFGQNALVYDLKPVSPAELVTSAVEVFRSQITGMTEGTSGSRFSVSVEPGLPEIRADANALTQLVLNLLDNAAKYGAGDGGQEAVHPPARGERMAQGHETSLAATRRCAAAVGAYLRDATRRRRSVVRGESAEERAEPTTNNEQLTTAPRQPYGRHQTVAGLGEAGPRSASAATEASLRSSNAGARAEPTASNQQPTTAPVHVDVRMVVQRKRWSLRRTRWVAIAVRDHGAGISPREIKRIFREFYRAPGASDRNLSGVGVGLALCKHVAAAHGGWIEAESKPGKGSVFTVYLPGGEVSRGGAEVAEMRCMP